MIGLAAPGDYQPHPTAGAVPKDADLAEGGTQARRGSQGAGEERDGSPSAPGRCSHSAVGGKAAGWHRDKHSPGRAPEIPFQKEPWPQNVSG